MNSDKEIGSDFKIPFSLIFKKKTKTIPKNTVLLSSGRDCLEYIIKKLGLEKEKKTVLLPSYLCDSITVLFKKHDITVNFYKVNKNLEIDLNDFNKKMKNVSAAFIINYFGFLQPKRQEIKELCKKNCAALIEDDVQSFLSKKNLVGDIALNSFRKITPLPDGAALYDDIEKKGENVRLKRSFRHGWYVLLRSKAGIMKNVGFLKPVWRWMFAVTEKKLIDKYSKPAGMSSFSRNLLQKLDFEEIKIKRRENYASLAKELENIRKINVMFPTLPKDVCPSGLPILCKDRDGVKKHLIENKIYPPIHWLLPEVISKSEFRDSWWLSDRILTIPIDQRYDKKDMERIVKALKNV